MWQIKALDPRWKVIPKRSLQSPRDWLIVTDEQAERLTELANSLERLEEGNPWGQRVLICLHGVHDTEHGLVDSDRTSRAVLLRPLLHPMQKYILACPMGTSLNRSWVTFSFAKERASFCMAAIRASSHICIR